MVACLSLCHVAFVDINRLSTFMPLLPDSCTKLSSGSSNELMCGFGFRRKQRLKRKIKLVVTAELSNSFTLNLGLDSQRVFDSHDPSQLPWVGPVPGDIAEVEAYCRIFRSAERLHAAVMDTLCNPVTGECMVSYEFTAEEKPLLEDKIVSVLGCMLSLLNKGREDVLSGRSSLMNSFRGEVSVTDDMLPPLAVFRAEMKRCCESLHVALENYLTSEDGRSLNVWRKLQRLKNVCYDSGFPRCDDYPCHTLFSNWNTVYFSTSKEDIVSNNSEVAFYKGGQVTEEGLNWLLEKGFKTIIDLRAETVKDNFYEAALDDAISSGKVELVKIPVEVRTAPSKEQVGKFASLVMDQNKRRIYLHSKEGNWRTSAMVSRWRQYMTRNATQSIATMDKPKDGNKIEMQSPSTTGKKSILEQNNGQLQEALDDFHISNGVSAVSPLKDEEDQSMNGAHNGLVSSKDMTSKESGDNGLALLTSICLETYPLKAQFPPSNVFSKAEMSEFFKTRKISPPSYSKYQFKQFRKNYVPRDTSVGTVETSSVVASGTSLWLAETKRSNGSITQKNLSSGQQNLPSEIEKFLSGNSYVSNGSSVSAFGEREGRYVAENNASSTKNNSLSKYAASKSIEDYKSDSAASLSSSDDEMGSIEGDMCASATGVVRVQSRKKAEMFLVRTDGFSCTREKVTESSLAFTHPSTQQQMLMWKSPPKTVLLLKKLGQELMEEAKEVASFLYHQEKMNVLVEPDVHDIFARIPGFGFIQTFYSQDTSDLHERVDFVACLGGDGVILHASNLFRGAVPPVVSFNLGSLGFLTSHNFEDYRQDLKQVIHGNNITDGVYITLRMRLRCELFRNGKAVPGKVFDVLNEVVVDRGSNPYLSKIECYEHDRLITKVQGDGVIVATPTGSTAYSTAAGGSMVHPNVPCMLFTPICAHSLSFRPVILPDSARLELKIPDDAQSNAWVSFDGKRRQQLSGGDSVRIHMSQHPLPTVNKSDQTGDWFHSLIRCLNWNERLDQKAL